MHMIMIIMRMTLAMIMMMTTMKLPLMMMMLMMMMYGHPTHPQWFEHQYVEPNMVTPSLPLRLLSLQSGLGVSCVFWGVAASI